MKRIDLFIIIVIDLVLMGVFYILKPDFKESENNPNLNFNNTVTITQPLNNYQAPQEIKKENL